MHFTVIGINHHIAPIAIREKVHFSETDIIDVSDRLCREDTTELTVLSTCNRSELYLVRQGSPFTREEGVSFFEHFFHLSHLGEYLFCLEGLDALIHLMKVTCGLDSLVIGEDQILGQVRDAHRTAMNLGTSKKILNRFFREAVTLAKKIKTETEASDQPLSIAYIGVKKIAEQLDLSSVPALVIGMGKMGRLAMEYLLDQGARVSISNRTYSNSLLIKEKHPELTVVPYEQLEEAISRSAVIISATASPHTILTPDHFKDIAEKKYVMDLSLPRDVHPAVRELEHVSLYDIDSLESISQENLARRQRLLEAYVQDMRLLSLELLDWLNLVQLDPIMKGLNERCDEIASDTLDYIFRKTALSHSQKMKVEKVVRSALKKAAREPVLYIKKADISAEDRTTALRVLEGVYGL